MIIILSADSEKDPCVPLVEKALKARGADYILFNPELFPAHNAITTRLDHQLHFLLHDGSQTIRLTEKSVIWHRYFEIASQLDADLRDDYRDFAKTQSQAAFQSLLDSVPGRVVDRPQTMNRVGEKPYQMWRAHHHGLQVPRTCVTNQADEVRSFGTTCPLGMIAKVVQSGSLATEDGNPIYAFKVGQEHMEALDESLTLGPMIFQEWVPKAREVRVTAIGNKLFSAEIVVGDDAPIDWRSDATSASQFRETELPPHVEKGIRAMLKEAGVQFATADLIVTPTGEYVFLELNTLSFFDFIEEHTGLPISAALAQLLETGSC